MQCSIRSHILAAALLSLASAPALAQHGAAAYQVLPPQYGPFSGHFLAGGEGLEKPLPETDPLLKATTPWTMTAWVEVPAASAKPLLIAGMGNATEEDSRLFAIVNGRLALWFGKNNVLTASTPLPQQQWHFFAASFDGQAVRLYSDGVEVAKGTLLYGRVAPHSLDGARTISASGDCSVWGAHRDADGVSCSQERCGDRRDGEAAAGVFAGEF